eukprot:scaffold137342_cov36-Prasinocladus_malaysianus.AAC.1
MRARALKLAVSNDDLTNNIRQDSKADERKLILVHMINCETVCIDIARFLKIQAKKAKKAEKKSTLRRIQADKMLDSLAGSLMYTFQDSW